MEIHQPAGDQGLGEIRRAGGGGGRLAQLSDADRQRALSLEKRRAESRRILPRTLEHIGGRSRDILPHHPRGADREASGSKGAREFLENLKRQFPVQTPEKVQQFAHFERRSEESLLSYYGRLRELALDMECTDERRLISKFLNGLDRNMVKELRGKVFEMGWKATLHQVYDLACRYETGLKLYELEKAETSEAERRRGMWMASPPGEAKARDESPSTDRRRCHRCGQVGHLQRECSQPPRCDTCGETGHLRRDCPRSPTCKNCGRKGHRDADCYAKRPLKGRSKSRGEIEEEMRKLREQGEEMGVEERGTEAMFAAAEEDEENQSVASFALMARPGARGDEHRQQGGEVLRAGIPGGGHTREQRCEEDPEFIDEAYRRPRERMLCQSTVLVAAKGSVVVAGIPVDMAIIDTGSHHVLIGKGLAEQMQLHEEGRLRERGFSVMTADGGEPKWLPCTRNTVEIVLKPGERDECRVKLTCGVTESEDYDLLMGIRLLYAVGATICTWQEKVIYRPRFWRPGGPRGTLPVRFVSQEPKGAYQARAVELEDQLEEMSWYEAEAELRQRELREAWAERKEVIPREVLNKRVLQKPIKMLELFGGLGTGLAAALKAGWRIEKWIYVEANPRVRKMTEHHVEMLRRTYPGQLLEGATEGNWGQAGHDVREITEAQITAWGRVDVLIAGWECQGVSRAGDGLGLEDERSVLFEDMVRVMRWVHRIHGEYLYVLENPDFATDPREPVRAAYQRVTSLLGAGVAMDAAQAGSTAHRDRRYWQNGLSEGRLRLELSKLKRPEARLVRDILEPNRQEAPVRYPDHPALYPCNTPDQPREAWPTLVAHATSYAFQMREGVPGPGMVKDLRTGEWGEPTALERELAMGFLPGATAADGVAEWERKPALGQGMDVQAMEWLLHTLEVQLLLWDMEIQVEEKEWWAKGRGPNSDAQWQLDSLKWKLDRLTDAEEQIRKRGWPPGEEGELAVKSRVAKRSCVSGFMALRGSGEPELAQGAAAQTGIEVELEVGPALSAKQTAAMKEMLKRHRKAFAFSLKELGKSKVGEMKIELTSDVPTYQRKRRMTKADEEVCREKCQELLEAGLIRRSTSEYAAATVVAARKDMTGEILSRRMCGDYRDLNKITKANLYPMPVPEDIFDKLEGARVFATLDLRQGFNQIQIREEDKAKTAFHGVDELWEWNGLPFGMKNSSAVFQQAMDTVLRGIECAACYIDDVIVFSKDAASHVADVEKVLGAIMEAGLTCHPSKCRFGESTVRYLGFAVSEGTISIQEAKVAVLDKVVAPTDRSRLRAVLGFLNYYRKFVPNFSRRASVLNQLLRESSEWKWGKAEDLALKDLLKVVKTGPVLVLPRRDKPFTLYTDWSSLGIGAVLCQETEVGERVVAFASRSCSPTEANYSSYEGEGLAAVWAVNHFRVYLQGSPFTLVTDHQPLTWLMTNQTLTGRNARWTTQLQEYEFKIRHRPGKTLQHVDGLSRNPPPAEGEPKGKDQANSPSLCLAVMARGRVEADAAKYRAAGPEDIWGDPEVLRWVKGETEADEEVSDRARARGQHYRWYQQQLLVQSQEGWKAVPPPEERRALIEKVHKQLGHYGHGRTAQLMVTSWWWAGLHRQVREVVAECELCSRNKAQLERER